MNMIKIRYWFFIIGFAWVCTGSVIMLITFLLAFLHPSKTVTIGINWMGEANIELFLFLGLIPVTLFLIWEIQKNFLPKIKAGVL